MDAVVIWLDTTQKDYIKQRNKDFGEKQPYDIHRIGRRDELRFCLRSLYYNLPWLRKIYLVTWDTQFPEWLDEDACAKLTPPILKIKRETLSDGKYIYGSLAVEACIHKIPGLSELFIYANCDMFVVKKMAITDWAENGVGKLQKHETIESFKPRKSKVWNYDTLTQIGLFIEKYGKPAFKFFTRTHNITIFSKKAYEDIKADFPKLYENTIDLKGREEKGRITRSLVDYVGVHKGYCKLSPKKIPSEYLNYETDYKNYVLKNDTVLFCANLNSYFKESYYNDFMRFMLQLFPKPLPCEKYLSFEHACYYTYGKNPSPRMCLKKPTTKLDNICLLPVDKSYNITSRIPYLRRTLKKPRHCKKEETPEK